MTWETSTKRQFKISEATEQAMREKQTLIEQGKPESEIKEARRNMATLAKKDKRQYLAQMIENNLTSEINGWG